MPGLFDSLEPLPEAASAPPEAGPPLNAAQRAAVEHGEGPLLVVAGAGTGKTRVITERIRHLLASDPQLPGQAILGLTFTEKAAGEMKHRVVQAVGQRGRDVCLGTFHAFCSGLLLERNPLLKTIENEDHWILLRRNLPALACERYRHLSEPGQFLSDFLRFFSRCQDELVTPANYERHAEALAAEYVRERARLPEDEQHIREELIAQQREIARAYRASDRLLRERDRLTFGMQLLDAVTAFDADPEFAARQRARFRYILVDEFQDTNYAQIELLWRLAGDHRNIVAVGDDAQAIYRFRGASFGSFTIFLRRFAGLAANPGASAARFVKPLVDNYRSTARVLRVAARITDLLERSPLLPKTELVPHKPDGEKVRVAEFSSAVDEARWIAGEIARLHAAGQPWHTFAALYRIHGHRHQLVAALEELGIPFRIRNLSILEHPLVRDLLAYLRLIARPYDNVACARVLAAPAWGLEPADLVRMCERAQKLRKSLADVLEPPQGELPFAAGAAKGAGAQPHDRAARLRELAAGLAKLREQARRVSAIELFALLAEWLDLAAVSAEERRYADRLAQFIREWQPKSETARLAEFVEYLDYFAQAGGNINLEQEGGDAVQLMTVHAAKGLEFDHVFVLRLTHRSFPMGQRASLLEFPETLMKEDLPRGGFHQQEERRLFYVALTRARERLTLTTVVHKHSKPSIFLDDILGSAKLLREDLKQLAPVSAQAAAAAPAAQAAPATASLFPAPPVEKRPSRVHSQIGAWAIDYRPPVFEPLQLSVSSIDCYRNCPQKYLFRDVWNIPSGPRAATTFGNVMHTTIKQFLTVWRRGQRPSFEEMETIFRREWTSAGFEDRYQEQCYQQDGLAQLRAFYQSFVAAPPEIVAQEKRFKLALENNIEIVGRVDQINRLGEGEFEIVDYKTGKPKTESQADKDLQLGVYALAAREDLETDPVRLVYHNLQNGECVASARDEKALRKVVAEIQEVAGDIRAREFPPQPGYICKGCEFRFLCPAMEPRQGALEANAGDRTF